MAAAHAKTHVAHAKTRVARVKHLIQKRGLQQEHAYETTPDYYAINQQPAYNMFGAPDFVDSAGREYRIAFTASTVHQPVVLDLIHLRAHASGIFVHATLDDYLATLVRDDPFTTLELRPVVTGAEGNVRLWIRLPRHKNAPVPWVATEIMAPVSLVYVGDNSIAKRTPGEQAVADVTIRAAMRHNAKRKTGYVDVAGMSQDTARALLARRLEQVRNVIVKQEEDHE